MNSTKTLQNDKLNLVLLTQSISSQLASDQKWIPSVTAAINYCSDQVNFNAVKIKASLKGDQVNGKTICSSTSGFMLGCMFINEFRNCPEKTWNTNKDAKCNDLKDYFDQCRTPLLF